MRIQYLYQEGVPACSKEPLKVRLDGKIIGAIHKVTYMRHPQLRFGYQYVPKGCKVGDKFSGAVMGNVDAVQRSLEED